MYELSNFERIMRLQDIGSTISIHHFTALSVLFYSVFVIGHSSEFKIHLVNQFSTKVSTRV